MFKFLAKKNTSSNKNQTHVSITLSNHLLNKSRNSNVVFSPLSIHVVLNVIAAGSKGQTHNQLLSFLKAKNINELNALSSQLVSMIMVDGSPVGGPRLSFANGVWVEQTVSLKPSFKKVVETVYKAACNQVDFQTRAGEVANEVNLWAERQTNGLIKDILPPGAINNSTRLIFANAIYFKGAWCEKFDPSNTKDFDFHLLDGSKVLVPFMTSKEEQFVSKYDNFKVLALPYENGNDKRRFTMYIYLPDVKDGLPSLIQKVASQSDFLEHHIPHQKVEIGQFLIPKFKISFGFEASDMLKELGLVLPFSSTEGLSEMGNTYADEKLYVSSIQHKSFVEVNEEGTEAAAVTGAVMMLCALEETYDTVDFVADHPFLFVIKEDTSGAVLFMGQVVDPTIN
ncbi:serpin-ZX-like [Rutidosis leptorrhynchoides]|uniref:serpin-ZX-like n=1 Tax=Rutidosis leptorrhynchoides TaxID=125765 RepID=UPI003A99263C